MTARWIDTSPRARYEHEIDVALAGSFPASDPLPWTLGFAVEPEVMMSEPLPRPRADAIDVVVSASRSSRRARAIAEVIGFTLLVPVAILLLGAPIAAAVRAVLSLLSR